MSLWFRRKDKHGGVHWYAVGILPSVLMILLALIAIALTFLLPRLQQPGGLF